MRSVCQIESIPPASQRSTQRQNPSVLENGNSISPTPTAILRVIIASHARLRAKRPVSLRLSRPRLEARERVTAASVVPGRLAKRHADLLVQYQVSVRIEPGRFAVQNDQPRPVAHRGLGE